MENASTSEQAQRAADVQRVVISTHNSGKIREIDRVIREALAERSAAERSDRSADAQSAGTGAARPARTFEFVTSGELGLPDPVEDGTTFEQNALLKARDAARRTGLPAIADDSGLIVDVLGMAPGILSARWSGRHGDDAANNALLLAQLADIPDAARGARFRCAAALVVPAALAGTDADVEAVEVRDMEGRLLREPRGTNGFGYDPLFVPNDQPDGASELTSAELTAEQKNAISHRGKALRALAARFSEILL
ncbi:non-canonical purine NTP pyrophosphatase [Alloscardovia macacae]|uniref:dITP/XTP pyrophosphatase n=1 Tax=Alloscardovia macacae TaxID=1160091 RepID=A0A261F7I5_9BIFI|nr:non-canonical purine NTP pyrophosphatase [Alloscardovia macacae]OZG54993.1 non-canonical purine NTP pyrophosphatase [Alloscardovia macacae]